MAQLISIDDLSKNKPLARNSFALFELGFRPFFLLGSVFAFLAIIPWVLTLHGALSNSNLAPNYSTWWHAHEMIFGFALAIIMGFLLTAAQDWTGVPSARGGLLIGLVVLWLLPRVGLATLAALPQFPLWLWACSDLAATIGVTLVLARMIVKVQQWRNAPFVLIMSVFALLNAMSYYDHASGQSAWATHIHYAAVWLIAIVVNLMGGRVIPAFTQNAVKYGRKPESPWLLRLTSIGLVLMGLAWLFDVPLALRIVAGFTALALFYRWHLWGWYATARTPLLWSLHISFVALPLACALLALGYPTSGALHLLTIGAIAGLIIAMMSRVSLGHTARMLVAPRWMKIAYAAIIIAAVLRALATYWPQAYLPLIDASVLFWLLSFGCFWVYYTPMLLRARLDGKRG